MVRTKVFVGNLSFKITEDQLVQEFSQAGKVNSANIISRGNRSLGYGFVELESEEEANKAVQLLHKKDIEGREINVEVAKPREEGAPGAGPGGAGSDAAGGQDRPRRARAPRGPRGPRAPREGAPAGDNAQSSPAQGSPSQQGQQEGGAPRRRKQRRGPRGPKPEGGAPEEGSPSQQPGERRSRPPRAPRQESGPRNPSTTTLFVANLPFSVNDESLRALFQGIEVKSAHVVVKQNGRSKGFGFVEFNTEADQHAALQQVANKEVDGRQLAVKVALTENIPTGDSSAAPAPAPAQQQ